MLNHFEAHHWLSKHGLQFDNQKSTSEQFRSISADFPYVIILSITDNDSSRGGVLYDTGTLVSNSLVDI
jgi:hypothetical protein